MQKKYKAPQKSNISTLFNLATSFKDSCDPELDLEMLNHMFTDSIVYSDRQSQNICEIRQSAWD